MADQLTQYRLYRSAGYDHKSAAHYAGMNPNQAALEEGGQMLPSAPDLEGAKFGSDTGHTPDYAQKTLAAYGYDAGQLNNLVYDAEGQPVMINRTDLRDTHGTAWSKIAEGLSNVADIFSVGLATTGALLTGNDIREGIPTQLLPKWLEEQWEKEGIQYVYRDWGDVVDHHFDNVYTTTLHQLDAKGGFWNKAAGYSLRAGEFATNAVFDWTNIVGGAIATKTVRAMRAALPLGTKAQQAINTAVRSRTLNNIDDAVRHTSELEKRLAAAAKANPTVENLDKLEKARESLLVMQREQKLVESGYEEMLDLVPHRRADTLGAPPGKDAPAAVREAYEARVKALKTEKPLVSFYDAEENVRNFRQIFGPDDTEFASEGLSRLVKGAHIEDVPVRTSAPGFSVTRTSTNLRPVGVGIDGHLTPQMARSKDLFKKVGDIRYQLDISRRTMKERLARVKDLPADQRKAARAGLNKRVKDLDKQIKKIDKELEHFNKVGQFHPRVAKALKIELPNGPRRDMLSGADFVENSFGKFADQFLAPALHPGNYMPNILPLKMQFMVREPIRILDKIAPGTRDLVEGGMRKAQLEITSSRQMIQDVLVDAGVLEKKGLDSFTRKMFNVGVPGKMRTNDARGKILQDLLDSAPGTPKHEKALELADESLLLAHTKLRKWFDGVADKLSVAREERITGYFPRIFRQEEFDAGNLHPVFQGTSTKKLPFFMKARKGKDFELPSITETLDAYTRGVAKELHVDPMIRTFRQQVQQFAATNPKNGNAAIRFADALEANLRGRPSTLRQLLDAMPIPMGAFSSKTVAGIGTLTYQAALTGNIRYPIMAITQAVNSTSAKYGMLRSLKGLAWGMTAEGKAALRATGLDGEYKQLFQGFQGIMSETATSFRPGILPSIAETEDLIRGVTLFASLDKHAARFGFEDAREVLQAAMSGSGKARQLLARGVSDAQSMNHIFGVLGRPVPFQRLTNSGMSGITQFMSFPFKQSETILANTLENPGYLVDYLMIAGKMTNLGHQANVHLEDYMGLGYVKDIGRDVTSMPTEVVATTLDAGLAIFNMDMTLEEKQEKLAKAGKVAAANLTPLKTFFEQRVNMVRELDQGVQRSKHDSDNLPFLFRTGEKVRPMNYRLHSDKNEMLATLLSLKSGQDKVEFELSRVRREAKRDFARESARFAKRAHDAMLNPDGQGLTREDIARFIQAGKKEGITVSQKTIRSIMENEALAYHVYTAAREAEDNPQAFQLRLIFMEGEK